MAVATWRSALIAAIGVVLGLAGPLHATSSADDVSAQPIRAVANAQLRSSDSPAANDQSAATAQTMPASTPDAQPAATNPVVAAAEAPAAREAAAQSSTSEHSIWDETSLIGKIFIGFGALLTIASAARMFMA